MIKRIEARAARRIDIVVENHGSIFILRGMTDAGYGWVEEHCSEGDYSPFGHGARLVGRRYIDPIIDGAGHDGLRVQITSGPSREWEVR